MPRFFFHLREGDQLVRDLQGQDLPDVNTACSEAVAGAQEIVSERIKAGKSIDEHELHLCDESGAVLEWFPFSSVLKAS